MVVVGCWSDWQSSSPTLWLTNYLQTSLAVTSLVPTHDLEDPGQRLSRNKLDLAQRIVEVTTGQIASVPPHIAKACYVYIYIALRMSEKVIERPGYPHNGFSSCCVTAGMSKEKFNFLRGEMNMNKCFVTYCTALSSS